MIPRRAFLLGMVFAVLLAGCASSPDHQPRIEALRARLPYVTRIGNTRSMDTVLDAGQLKLVQARSYDRLQSGDIAIFWPSGLPFPVCHFVGHRIGTDSWSTYSMAQSDGLGFLLTRENYIGVIL